MPIRPTILVVEDEPELRQVVVDSLESTGFTVAQAGDATDAMARLEGFAYDGLVLDLRLPDGDGMDILDAAIARYPDIRSVVMTGCGGVSEAVTAIKRGALDFVTKPFALRDLAERLRRTMVRPGAADAPEIIGTARQRFSDIVGDGPAMRQVFSTLERVAPM